MVTLFEQVGISFHSLEDSDHSYDTLMLNSEKINMSSKEILEMFYSKYITSPDKMYQYVLNPEWGEASGNYRMRFLIIILEDDYILVPLKVMDPMGKERYFSISMELVSYNSSMENIIKVMRLLQSFDSIKFISLSGNFDKEVYMNNFYNTLEEFTQMNRSVWKSKKGINKMSKLIVMNSDYYPEAVPDLIKQVDDLWNAQKKSEKKTTLPAKVDISLAKMWGKSNDMFMYLYFYKDKILGYSIGVTTVENYVSLLSTKSLTQLPIDQLSDYLKETDESIVKQIQKFLGAFIQYTIHKDILFDKGFDALYYYGDVHSKSLHEFKQDYYKRVINSYKVSLGEYIQILENKM